MFQPIKPNINFGLAVMVRPFLEDGTELNWSWDNVGEKIKQGSKDPKKVTWHNYNSHPPLQDLNGIGIFTRDDQVAVDEAGETAGPEQVHIHSKRNNAGLTRLGLLEATKRVIIQVEDTLSGLIIQGVKNDPEFPSERHLSPVQMQEFAEDLNLSILG